MKNKILLLIGILLVLAVTSFAADKRFTVVIDAGHGGDDAGAIGSITKEKTINLNVALAFGRLVERNCPDVKVIYTRKTDVFVPLHTRADIANRNKADLFISIHTNSLPKGRVARGLETYTLGMHRAADNLDVAQRENAVILIEDDYKQRYEGFDPKSAESYIMFEFIQDKNMEQSVQLAKFVQQRTTASSGRANKGVKQAGFLVLRETSMPSCLIELGFISTPDEEQFLHSSTGVDRLAQGIYQAFLDYKRKYNKGVTVPYRSETKQSVTVPAITDAAPITDAASTQASNQTPAAKPAPVPQPTSGPVAQQVAEPTAQPAPEPSVQPAPVAQSAPATQSVTPASTSTAPIPVFKVQILASSSKLKANDSRLKGEKNVDCYQENGMYKYTVGASADYSEIYQLRKQLVSSFPEAFIIAFKDGQKVDVQAAIREYRKNKAKK